jgi:Mg/Co/Ni transporter MgtE
MSGKGYMILEQVDKYLKQADIVYNINSVNRMSIGDIIEYLINIDEEQKMRVLSILDINKREQVEKLIEGGLL